MSTTYVISLKLYFSELAKCNTVYDKLKTALANAKQTDAWDSGMLRKEEVVSPDSTQEDV